MEPPLITVDTIHSEVIARPGHPTPASARVQIELGEPIRNGRILSVGFTLSKETPFARTVVTGVVAITSDSDEELDELAKRLAEDSGPPPEILWYVLLRLQPLILLVEDYMGVPPIPVLPGPQL